MVCIQALGACWWGCWRPCPPDSMHYTLTLVYCLLIIYTNISVHLCLIYTLDFVYIICYNANGELELKPIKGDVCGYQI